ncbi:hypothetical protein JMA_15960 [Jeotgalibacillus malaysiensis]|uniref:Rod shape-determining protein RodA n=1 Tax=Jeotgalibacillus malaysiensis TaxID=1508404 RepID=A0A0B5AQW4_9BACL|nr:FtsW/RodA/SpoVE family cell cycle protein [Jeotgalibacillus malaysiensis]AJD90913.1 hypothetical protein JMA_15960 [Jeotgalibacillus malaysiensis]
MDRLLVLFILICSVFGVLLIDSASSVWALDRFGNAHFFFGQTGCLFSAGPYSHADFIKGGLSFWYRHATLIYLVTVVLLIIVLIPGIGLERNGSQSWIGVGPLSVQPAELAKAGVLMLTAGLISIQRKKLSVRQTFLLMIIVLFPFGIIMLQPDLGTGTVLAGSGLALLFLAGVSIRFFMFLFGAGAAGFAGLVIAAPYRMQRIYSFLDPLAGSAWRGISDYPVSLCSRSWGAFWCGVF